jgi:hypothetical protein
MKTNDGTEPEIRADWLPMVGLAIMLFLMYSSTFLTDYLMNDEWAHLGNRTADALTAMEYGYRLYGRGLFGLYEKLVYDFVDFNTARIQFVRFVNFASIACIAVFLLAFLQGRTKSAYFAFFVALLLFSQLPWQGLMGYSLQLISNSQPAMWLSLLAFYLCFYAFERSTLPIPLQAAIVFLILMLAMQSTQLYAFVATIPVAFLALTDWQKRKRRVTGFLIIAFAVLALSALAYGATVQALHIRGEEAYRLGEQGFSQFTGQPMAVIANALNPLAYWSVFKLWTFPFPFHNISPMSELREQQLAVAVMVAWLCLVLGALYIELRQSTREDRRDVVFKWLAVLCCFALAAVFLIADSPSRIIDHRPHVYLTFSGLVILTGAYAIRVIASKWRFLQGSAAKAIAAVFVVSLAFGAQAGVLRNMVDNHKSQIDFMRTELLANDPDTYKTVLVVAPQWQGCITEPCGQWFGQSLTGPENLGHPEAYRYALATIGIDPWTKKITFASQLPEVVPSHTVVIDWQRYSRAAQRSAGYFSGSTEDR